MDMVARTCPTCGTHFTTKAFRLKHGRGTYCSRSCAARDQHHPITDLRVRFLRKVAVGIEPGDCWLWTGAIANSGYGSMMVRTGQTEQAHRLSYELHHGPIPPGKWVLHTCDVRACVAPHHLFLGTRQDNIDDMMDKGRNRQPSGTASQRAKLSDDDVRAIRAAAAAGERQVDIAARFGITQVNVSWIVLRKGWKHID